ncbi:MAG: hypothetical protein FD174_2666 [Geobacteraceae bacterium]|nr:MAG: hypothetical protein FD174_2666 [Geobacteraceae bacterium]
MKKLLKILGLTLCALGTAWTAHATVVTIPQSALTPSTQYYTDIIGGGIGSSVMARNDDHSTGALSLGFTLPFFGQNYTQFYINNNGNITFNGPLGSFTPSGPQGATQPIISPFFADVDTRNSASGLVYLRNDITNQIIVTWDQVGYFASHADKLDSFQLVLRGPGYAVPVGEGNIGFFWKTMQWETGDASGGSGGFGGTEAAVGFGDGLSNGEILQGSTLAGISGVVNNHHIWFDPNLRPIDNNTNTVPEPSTFILFGAGLAGFGLLRRKFKR